MNVIFWNSLNGGQDLLSRYVGPYKINHWIKKHGYTGQVIEFLQYLTEEEIEKISYIISILTIEFFPISRLEEQIGVFLSLFTWSKTRSS